MAIDDSGLRNFIGQFGDPNASQFYDMTFGNLWPFVNSQISGNFGGDGGANGGFQSGFRPPPAGGFSLTPPQNYWQGGNFMAPGVSGSPLMTSSVGERFPGLQGVLGGQSPPVAQPGAASPQPQGQQHQGLAGLLSGLRNDPRVSGLVDKFRNSGLFSQLQGRFPQLGGLLDRFQNG
jgi:hypothetical protein